MAESSSEASRPHRISNAHGARPVHQRIHAGRKKQWASPVPTGPAGAEATDVPYFHHYSVDPRTVGAKVLKVFKDKPRRKKDKGKGKAIADPSPYNDEVIPGVVKRRYSVIRTKDGMGPQELGVSPPAPHPVDDPEPESEPEIPGRDKRQYSVVAGKRPMVPRPAGGLPAHLALPPLDHNPDPVPKNKKGKGKRGREWLKNEDTDYRRHRSLTMRLAPIPENTPLRIPRLRPHEPEEPKFDPEDPLVSWYFPRKSPDYFEMLNDVAKMFDDLHMQEVALKHFQRPIDYVTVRLSLSNVVFAELFETLQAKVSDGQYRIEFVASGRTGVNLYLSAYSREHVYIAKSLLHKVKLQVDTAKRFVPSTVMQYMQLVQPVERGLVPDPGMAWGRVPDGQFSTFTDIDSPTVIHEVAIAETRQELYWRCKRYFADVPSVNLVVAIKVENSECEWAELLVLARDPRDDAICKVWTWVRFWGDGAVSGDLLYYMSDFLEVDDRWKIPTSEMRPFEPLHQNRRPIIKISFKDLGKMVSMARWENQALMGYIKKPYPWPALYGGLTYIEKVSLEGERPPPPPANIAKAFAVAEALHEHHFGEPYIPAEWRREARREFKEMLERGVEEDDAASSVYEDEEREAADGEDDATTTEGEETEAEAESSASASASASASDKGSRIWGKRVTGLI